VKRLFFLYLQLFWHGHLKKKLIWHGCLVPVMEHFSGTQSHTTFLFQPAAVAAEAVKRLRFSGWRCKFSNGRRETSSEVFGSH
jgi:hypothetical protein